MTEETQTILAKCEVAMIEVNLILREWSNNHATQR